MELKMDMEKLYESIQDLFNVTRRNIMEYGAGIGDEMEYFAKRYAPWTDRTGNARRSLKGFCEARQDRAVYIGVLGGMPYSPDLELGYGKRYAILVPTVEGYAPKMIDKIREAVAQEGGLTIV